MLVVMGFIVYYIIPYAFTFQDLPLFFTVLILILLGTYRSLVLFSCFPCFLNIRSNLFADFLFNAFAAAHSVLRLGMLLGLSLLGQTIQPYVELLMLKVCGS